MSNYTGEQTRVLEELEPIQHNPAMYIGDTAYRGLHHLALEVLSNSIDEAICGYGNEIIVTIHKDGSLSIQDQGRGIPVDIHPKYNIPTVEVLATKMSASGKFDPESNYSISAGLHGLGLKCVNALSEFTEITVIRDGHKYRQSYSFGVTQTPLVDLGKTNEHTGTTVHFKPSPKYFRETTTFDPNNLKQRLQEFSYLATGIKFIFINEITSEDIIFVSSHGLADMLADNIQEKEPVLSKPIYITGTAPAMYKDGSKTSTMSIELIMHFMNVRDEFIKTFANLAPTPQGGTGLTGFRTALTRAVNDTARQLGIFKDSSANTSAKELSEGLYMIMSIKHPSPTYQGQTKDALTNPDVQVGVSQIVYNYLMEYFEQNPKEFRLLIDYLKAQRRLKDQMKQYKDTLLNQGNKTTNNLKLAASGKLAGCTSSNADECEIMLVEGDSAGGTAKLARDKRTQAVYGMRGKGLNVERSTQTQVLQNQEYKDLIIALGCGILDNYDHKKLKYKKVIIASDADPDNLPHYI